MFFNIPEAWLHKTGNDTDSCVALLQAVGNFRCGHKEKVPLCFHKSKNKKTHSHWWLSMLWKQWPDLPVFSKWCSRFLPLMVSWSRMIKRWQSHFFPPYVCVAAKVFKRYFTRNYFWLTYYLSVCLFKLPQAGLTYVEKQGCEQHRGTLLSYASYYFEKKNKIKISFQSTSYIKIWM